MARIISLGLLIAALLAVMTAALSRTGLAEANPLTDIRSLAPGDGHTCARTEAGGVRCWGLGTSGQLGNGRMTSSLTPVDVAGLSEGVTAIAAEYLHTCALTEAGGVKCWGSNFSSQLGDGTNIDRATPVAVVGLTSGVSAISLAGVHTCALMNAGTVKCWGLNASGQLGTGTTKNSTTPVDVAGLSDVAAIAAAAIHTCALTRDGGVKCWGDNSSGQLGNGTTDNSMTPVDVEGLTSGVTAIAVGGDGFSGQFHTCALTTDGGVKCWGANERGQLGDGTTARRPMPVDVPDLTSDVVTITIGGQHTCAWTASAVVKCWGANDYGQLGDGTTVDRDRPTDVLGLSNSTRAGPEAGGDHTCVIVGFGVGKCWGKNGDGQLGDGTMCCGDPAHRATPVDVIRKIALGDVDCSGVVNSIDALLILQRNAALISSLACDDAADVNEDGQVNSVDAALILQFEAGLLESLPPCTDLSGARLKPGLQPGEPKAAEAEASGLLCLLEPG